MINIRLPLYLLTILLVLHCYVGTAQENNTSQEDIVLPVRDSLTSDESRMKIVHSLRPLKDTVDLGITSRSPYISVQQLLKGSIPGVYVQENSGEPGSIQSMLIRGTSSPVFSTRDVSGVQPAVFLNGIPLLTSDSYLYGLRTTDVNPIGTGTNILAGLNLDDLESLEVVKDAAELAKLGPLAANGAILIRLKDGYYGGSNVFIHANSGFAMPPARIRMTNAANELAFRSQFADLAVGEDQRAAYNERTPIWMGDFRDSNFFGEPGWTDNYYRLAPLYNVGASIGGGRRNANYIFMTGYTGDAGVADHTGYGRFVANYALNMTLDNGLGINLLLNGSRITRKANRNLRDQFAEKEYMPDLTTPLSPTLSGYRAYLDYYDQYNRDDNLNNLINGYLKLHHRWNRLYINSGLNLDYNTSVRHTFWPSGLMESVSFVSDFSGYNRRLSWNSVASYEVMSGNLHRLNLEMQGIVQKDVQSYNYTRAYDGIDDTKPTTNGGGFQYISRFVDKMENNLMSSFLSVNYHFKDLLGVKAVFRYDGASSVQKDNRWLFTPAFSMDWNIKNQFLMENSTISDWVAHVSWARIGRLLENNRFAAGPQYTGEELTGVGQPVVSSYYGFATVARPYNTGWVGYGIGWPYADKMNAGLSVSLFDSHFSVDVEYYHNTDHNMITSVPVSLEYGYKYKYESGMAILNTGFEVNLMGHIPSSHTGVSWDVSVGLAYNKNKLVALPDNLEELVVNNRKIKVGRPVDQFWVLRNGGTYSSDERVPTVDGTRLSVNGIPLSKNDPEWRDVDNNNVINDDDKVMKGHILPPLTGNMANNLQYGRFDLDLNLFFAAGHDAINYRSSQRYSFPVLENTPSLESVKEIFFWQNTNDRNDYPLYNQMSGVNPYRADQDLFLEKLWFVKLRSVSLGYRLPVGSRPKKKSVPEKTYGSDRNNIYLYITGNNLFTITDFSGDDPELVDFDGYYRGYGHLLPRSVVVGLKFNF